jgi:hypothetical protein
MNELEIKNQEVAKHNLSNVTYGYASSVLVQSTQDDIGVGFAVPKFSEDGSVYLDYHTIVRMPISVAKRLSLSINQAVNDLEKAEADQL